MWSQVKLKYSSEQNVGAILLMETSTGMGDTHLSETPVQLKYKHGVRHSTKRKSKTEIQKDGEGEKKMRLKTREQKRNARF